MKYQQPTFTLPTVNKPMTQTDYEIAVGLRNPDGSLVLPKVVFKVGKLPKNVRFRRISADSAIA